MDPRTIEASKTNIPDDIDRLAYVVSGAKNIGELEANQKPAAVVEAKLKEKQNPKFGNDAVTTDLVESLRDSNRYYLSSLLSPELYFALRDAYQERINQNKREGRGAEDISDQKVTYETLQEYVNKSKNVTLINFLKSLDDDVRQMPLCAFMAMNAGHSITTVSLVSEKPDYTERASSLNKFKIIDLSGIDFQSMSVVEYFYPRGQINDGRLRNVLRGLMDRQSQIIRQDGIDIVVGMPRGLVSFAGLLKPDQRQILNNVYWDEYFKMVAALPDKSFYINPLATLPKEQEEMLRQKYKVDNLHFVRGIDVRSLAIAINDKEHEQARSNPDYQCKVVGYDNAGDQMGLLNQAKMGRHWRVKGEGTTVGQDELTNATTLAGITTKSADYSNTITSDPSFRIGLVINNPVNEHGGTALINAAFMGNISEIQRLLKIPEIQIDVKDNKGNTALCRAILQGNVECAIAIINHGANLNEQVANDAHGRSIQNYILDIFKIDNKAWLPLVSSNMFIESLDASQLNKLMTDLQKDMVASHDAVIRQAKQPIQAAASAQPKATFGFFSKKSTPASASLPSSSRSQSKLPPDIDKKLDPLRRLSEASRDSEQLRSFIQHMEKYPAGKWSEADYRKIELLTNLYQAIQSKSQLSSRVGGP